MQFEWDEEKREKTLRERGIDFADAIHIWVDPHRQQRFDTREDYGEVRIQTIGMTQGSILFVVYTEREIENGVEIIRIISARRANKKEREAYHSSTFSIAAL